MCGVPGMAGARDSVMRLRTMLSVVVITLSAAAAAAPSALGAKGPRLTVPAEELEAALGCSQRISEGHADPVVLVHGSSTNAQASWRSGYVFALAADGIPACTVELPDHGMDDLQIATELVVYAIRTAAERSGRPVAVVGHSAGGLEPLWALRFWPELRGLVTDVVALSTPYSGGPRSVCDPDCAPVLWQASEGSRFLAVATQPPLPDGTSFTSLATASDGIVTPESHTSRAAATSSFRTSAQDGRRSTGRCSTTAWPTRSCWTLVPTLGRPSPAACRPACARA